MDQSTKTTTAATEPVIARASIKNLPISTKQSVEISNFVRYKSTEQAKKMLQEVAEFTRAVPFRRAIMDLGHKPGMAAGSYPQKAVQQFLKLIGSVEANAQFKGMNVASLKITKVLANKANIPRTGGRHQVAHKHTHLEIEVQERKQEAQKKSREKQKAEKKEKTERPIGEQKGEQK